jgi:hypothetical protein
MERRALVLALALTLPLTLYGIPYAYASMTSSSYTMTATIPLGTTADVHCNAGDYATGGGGDGGSGIIFLSEARVYDFGTNTYSGSSNGQTPNGWEIRSTVSSSPNVQVVCQTPITVAGVTVPQFGSLYVAIALGAVAYFMLSRRFTRRSTIPALVKA